MMTAEKLSAYVRLPYVNSISNPPLANLNDFKLLWAKTRKIIKEEEKLAKLCELTGIL